MTKETKTIEANDFPNSVNTSPAIPTADPDLYPGYYGKPSAFMTGAERGGRGRRLGWKGCRFKHGMVVGFRVSRGDGRNRCENGRVCFYQKTRN